jgi:hypothetical protein
LIYLGFSDPSPVKVGRKKAIRKGRGTHGTAEIADKYPFSAQKIPEIG